MSETWTEYAVRWPNGKMTRHPDAENARRLAGAYSSNEAVVVGRTVTASDWLPVDTDGGAA